jgi:hypothetical protein
VSGCKKHLSGPLKLQVHCHQDAKAPEWTTIITGTLAVSGPKDQAPCISEFTECYIPVIVRPT